MLRRLILLGCLPSTLSAQVVRGVVRDSASGEGTSGVLVTLVQQPSGVRRTVLADEQGRFAIGAPAAGAYTLETKRIGVRPQFSAEFTLATGETRELTVTVASAVPRLDAVQITGRSYCGERVREGAETATLWDEVRSALLAARITRDEQRTAVTLTSFTRVLDPKSLEVRTEERSERRGTTVTPFSAVPIASLSRDGYVLVDGEDLVYRGPDVDVLLSDAFVREHCFRAVRGTSPGLGLIGLSFEPTSARRVPDIAGVLWVDARTRELRRLEYRYVGSPVQPRPPFPLSYVDFARMPSGAWIVQRWAIRMPHMVRVSARGDGPASPLVVAEPDRDQLLAVIETGGEAVVNTPQPSRAGYEIAGVVFDSTAGVALGGARVMLRGTALAATTDAAGRFRIALPDSGTYMLSFDHPRLDSLNFDPPGRSVRVAGMTTADVAVPPLGAVRASLCPGSTDAAQRAIVHGTVRGVGGAPRAWTTMTYRWTADAARATLVTDSRGRYLICDVPPGRHRLALESEAGDVAETDLAIEAGQLVKRDLDLRRR